MADPALRAGILAGLPGRVGFGEYRSDPE